MAKLPTRAKTPKFPKSMGLCADRLFETRQKRLDAQKIVDALASEEKALKEHIINNLDKNDTGASGKHHRVQVVKKEIPQVEEWDKTYAYIKKNNAFDMLQRRLNTKAVMERIEDGKKVPGVKLFTAVDVSLTKI